MLSEGRRCWLAAIHLSMRSPWTRLVEGSRSTALEQIHRGSASDNLTLHCSTFLFTSSSSSFKISSLFAAEDAPGPAPAPVLLLELLAAWFSLWGEKEEAHLWSQCLECWVEQVCRLPEKSGMARATAGKSWNEVISLYQAVLGHFAAFSSRAALLSGAMASASEPRTRCTYREELAGCSSRAIGNCIPGQLSSSLPQPVWGLCSVCPGSHTGS